MSDKSDEQVHTYQRRMISAIGHDYGWQKMKTVLKNIEWSSSLGYEADSLLHDVCPVCAGLGPDVPKDLPCKLNQRHGHRDGCDLDDALRDATHIYEG